MAIPAMILCTITFSPNALAPKKSKKPEPKWEEIRISWYGGQFNGRKTANGERYNMHGLTAAHVSLPFNTKMELFNPANGQRVTVRINDRGPFDRYAPGFPSNLQPHPERDVDVSRAAAGELGIIRQGVANVQARVVP